MPADHIVVEWDLGATCQRCGKRAVLKTPVELDVWLAAMAAFRELHATCPAREKVAHPCEDTLESGIGEEGDSLVDLHDLRP